MDEARIDFISNGSASGEVASELLTNAEFLGTRRPFKAENGKCYITHANGDVEEIRGNATTLRYDEWKEFDTVLVKETEEALNAVQDLYNAGRVKRTNGLGKTVLQWETMADTVAATFSMDGMNRNTADRPEFTLNYLPLPIIHYDFYINARTLNASRNLGDPLDTTMIEMAGRKIAEKAESMLLTGTSNYTYGGGSIYGYADTNFSNRATVTLAAHWNDSAATGNTILTDTLNMIQQLENDYVMGPYNLYIPRNFSTPLLEDFKANSDKSIWSRLMEIPQLNSIKVCDQLTADNVALVDLRWVSIIEGLAPTVVEWSSEGGMRTHYKAMAIIVPQMISTSASRSGVCHGTL